MISQSFLYHGSRVPDIVVLTPRPHNAVDKRAVVFATPDIRFASAMIYGTGDQLAVGYVTTIEGDTHTEEMYIDELEQGALQLLDAPGYLYEVEPEGFYQDPALSHVELIKDTDAQVINMSVIPNILAELKKYPISIIPYADVPEAMKKRGQTPGTPENPHAPDRFQDVSE